MEARFCDQRPAVAVIASKPAFRGSVTGDLQNRMNITQLRQPIVTVKSQWLVLGVFENDANPAPELEGTAAGRLVERLRAEKEVTGSLGELTVQHEPQGLEAGSLVLVGLGPWARFDAGVAFSAAFTASKRIAGKRRESVAFVVPRSEDPRSVASAMIEGALVGTRSPGLRKTEPNRHAFGTLYLIIPPGGLETDDLVYSTRRGEIVGAAVNLRARPGQYTARREIADSAGRAHWARRRRGWRCCRLLGRASDQRGAVRRTARGRRRLRRAATLPDP